MALPFFFQYIVVVLFIGPMHDSFHHKKNKPQNLRDWGSESSIQNRIAAIVRNYFKLYEIKLVSHLAAIPSTVIVWYLQSLYLVFRPLGQKQSILLLSHIQIISQPYLLLFYDSAYAYFIQLNTPDFL